MATGDQADMAGRIRRAIPPNWFPAPPAAGGTSQTPVLDGLLAGLGAMWASLYALLAYTRLQTRLMTATGTFLDMIAADFFGTNLPRRSGEADAAYAARISAALRAAKNTRAAISAAVQAATGSAPRLIELMNAGDTKGLGSRGNAAAGGGYGFGCTGLRYGTRGLAGLFLVEMPAGVALAPAETAIVATKSEGVVAYIRTAH